MRKPKEQDEEGTEAQFFDDFESEDLLDGDDSEDGDARKQKKPARQRVELRNDLG